MVQLQSGFDAEPDDIYPVRILVFDPEGKKSLVSDQPPETGRTRQKTEPALPESASVAGAVCVTGVSDPAPWIPWALVTVMLVSSWTIVYLVEAHLVREEVWLSGVHLVLNLIAWPLAAFLTGTRCSDVNAATIARRFVPVALGVYVIVNPAYSALDALQTGDWQAVLRLDQPKAAYWVLPWLTLASLVATATRPWSSRRRGFIVVGIAAIVGIALWGWAGIPIGTQGWGLLPFFLAGAGIGWKRITDVQREMPSCVCLEWGGTALVVVTAVSLSLPAVAAVPGSDSRTVGSMIAGFVMGWLGLPATLVFSFGVFGFRHVAAALRLIGKGHAVILLGWPLVLKAMSWFPV